MSNPEYKETEDVALAKAMPMSIGEGFDDDELVPDADGHHLLFFGCCCDHRRAVIVINIISIVLDTILLVVTILGTVAVGSVIDGAMQEMDDEFLDDAFKQDFNTAAGAGLGLLGVVMLLALLVPLTFAVIGLYGALKYKQWALITNAVVISIGLVRGLATIRATNGMLGMTSLLLRVVMLYPHVCMIHLMRKGIMTPSNYRNIESCCSC